MSSEKLNVAAIVGSSREGRKGGAISDWFISQASPREDMVFDVIDLAEVRLPACYPSEFAPDVLAYVERIRRADAFVIMTPEYNHGYPASLKQAIDLSGLEWAAKPVGFVSYGGLAGGVRAVEQLRQVFPELHAITVRETVTLANFGNHLNSDGRFDPPAECNQAVDRMLNDLSWWARALRHARAVPVQESLR